MGHVEFGQSTVQDLLQGRSFYICSFSVLHQFQQHFSYIIVTSAFVYILHPCVQNTFFKMWLLFNVNKAETRKTIFVKLSQTSQRFYVWAVHVF